MAVASPSKDKPRTPDDAHAASPSLSSKPDPDAASDTSSASAVSGAAATAAGDLSDQADSPPQIRRDADLLVRLFLPRLLVGADQSIRLCFLWLSVFCCWIVVLVVSVMGFVFVIPQNLASIRSEEYRLLFRLPPEEVRIYCDLSGGSEFLDLVFVAMFIECDGIGYWVVESSKILVSL